MNNVLQSGQFMRDFVTFERNRMYPPGYERESVMAKLKMEHVDALVLSAYYVQTAAADVEKPQARHQLEDTLLRLAELKLYVLERMTEQHQLFPVKPDLIPDKDYLKVDGHGRTG